MPTSNASTVVKVTSYLALGDSVSIDKYTGLLGGGAASQFARLIGAQKFVNEAYDGCTTRGVLASLAHLSNLCPDVITLTAGGNDLLELAFGHVQLNMSSDSGSVVSAVLPVIKNYDAIAQHIARQHCVVITNTVYDPSNGDDDEAERMGIPRKWRAAYEEINAGIRKISSLYGFMVCDLQVLFSGHGTSSNCGWIVSEIEPNLKGATTIANEWYGLFAEGTKNK
jgi:lysophospholipase L1-like esterase